MSDEQKKILGRCEKLEIELKESIEAIEILTNKLINLAVIENKFLEQVEQLKSAVFKCDMEHIKMVRYREEFEGYFKRQKNYFQFRYPWMERLFIKFDMNWSS